jgi:hypothetical protein
MTEHTAHVLRSSLSSGDYDNHSSNCTCRSSTRASRTRWPATASGTSPFHPEIGSTCTFALSIGYPDTRRFVVHIFLARVCEQVLLSKKSEVGDLILEVAEADTTPHAPA